MAVEFREPEDTQAVITGDLMMPLFASWKGVAGQGVPLRQNGVVNDSLYAGAFQNTGSGGLSLLATSGNGANYARVNDAGVVVGGGMTVTGGATNVASLDVAGAAVIHGNTLTSTLNVNGASTLGGAVLAQAGLTVSTGGASITGSATVTGATTLVGDLTNSNASGTALLITSVASGAQTLTVGPTTAAGLFVDIANAQTRIGATAQLTGAASERFSVIGGRTYMQSGDRLALGLRNGLSDGNVYVGATSGATPSISFSNNGGGEIFSVTNAGLATIVSGATVLAGGVSVTGSSTFAAISATGSVTVTSGGISATGGSSIFNGVTIATGGLTIQAGDLTLSSGVLSVTASGGVAIVSDASRNVQLGVGSISTSANDGYVYIPSMNGAPTGTPTTKSGYAAICYRQDTARFEIYSGAWRSVAVT